MLVERHTDTPPDAWRARHMPQHWGDARQYPAPVLFGSNAVFRRDALLDVQGYDECFRTNTEDVNLCARLRAAGHKFLYTPTARAFHQRRDTVESLLRTRWNYELAHRVHQGCFGSIQSLAASLKDFLDAALAMAEQDLKEARDHLLAIDLLAFFHDAFEGARHCVHQGAITHAEGVRLQRALLQRARESLGAREMMAWFEEYLGPFALSPEGADEAPPGPPALETALIEVGRRLDRLPPVLIGRISRYPT